MKFGKWLKAIFGKCTYAAMRPSWSSVSSEEITFHHFLHHHLLHSMTFQVSSTHTQTMMRRRRIRDMTRTGRRPLLGTP
jgi:uncharacterized protein with von Willebrand factor type A (vWA) domain